MLSCCQNPMRLRGQREEGERGGSFGFCLRVLSADGKCKINEILKNKCNKIFVLQCLTSSDLVKSATGSSLQRSAAVTENRSWPAAHIISPGLAVLAMYFQSKQDQHLSESINRSGTSLVCTASAQSWDCQPPAIRIRRQEIPNRKWNVKTCQLCTIDISTIYCTI